MHNNRALTGIITMLQESMGCPMQPWIHWNFIYDTLQHHQESFSRYYTMATDNVANGRYH